MTETSRRLKETEPSPAEETPSYMKLARYFHPDSQSGRADFENILKIADTVPEGQAVLEKMAEYQQNREEKGKKYFHFSGRSLAGLNFPARQIYIDSNFMRKTGDEPGIDNKGAAARLIQDITYTLAALEKQKNGLNIDSPDIKAELTAQANANRRIADYRLGFVPPHDMIEYDRKSAGDPAVFHALVLKKELEIQKRPHQMFLHSVDFSESGDPRTASRARSNLDFALYLIENKPAAKKALESLRGVRIKEKDFTYTGEIKNTKSIPLNLSVSSEEIALEIIQKAKERQNVLEGLPQDHDVNREKFTFITENPMFEKAVIADADYRAFKKAAAAGAPLEQALAIAAEARKADEKSVRRVLRDAFEQTAEGMESRGALRQFDKMLKILEMTEDGRNVLESISKQGCAIRFDTSGMGPNHLGCYNAAANTIFIRPLSSEAQMAGVLRHEAEHMLQEARFPNPYTRQNTLGALVYQQSIEAAACAFETRFEYEINSYFPETAFIHPEIYKTYADEMNASEDPEKAWGKAFKAWDLAPSYEENHTKYAGLIAENYHPDKSFFDAADILKIVHPGKGCTVEPDFLYTAPLMTKNIDNVVNILRHVQENSAENKIPADSSALKIRVNPKNVNPAYVPLYDHLTQVIRRSAETGKPVSRTEQNQTHSLVTEMKKVQAAAAAETGDTPPAPASKAAVLNAALRNRTYGR